MKKKPPKWDETPKDSTESMLRAKMYKLCLVSTEQTSQAEPALPAVAAIGIRAYHAGCSHLSSRASTEFSSHDGIARPTSSDMYDAADTLALLFLAT